MKTYFDDLSMYESVKPTDKPKTIHIYDFDGTIFNSPLPNFGLWDKKMGGKLMGEFATGGYGWFQNTLSLDKKYIDISKFNDDVVLDVKKSMDDPGVVAVMMTGRTVDYTEHIKEILATKNLVFDEYILKPRSDFNPETTWNYKQRAIKELVDKYDPVSIQVWEDRIRHHRRFDEFLTSIDLNGGVHFIKEQKFHMPEELEKELVDKLIKDPRAGRKPPKKFKRDTTEKPLVSSEDTGKLIYAGVFLTEKSFNQLKSILGKEIPEGWGYVNKNPHMTTFFGKPKSEEVGAYFVENQGSQVELTAVELGLSDDAMAIKISSAVPTDNNLPHITFAIPPGGKPVNSNKITEWKSIPPIKLQGTVAGFYNKVGVFPKE